MNKQSQHDKHWFIYDGECPMCRRCTHWAIRHDHRQRFIAAPYQTAPEPPMTPDLRRACERAMHVVTNRGKVLRGAAAVMFIFQQILPTPLRFVPRLLGRAPWIWPMNVGYELIARNRMRIGRFFFPNEPQAPLELYQHEPTAK